MVTLVDGH